MVFARLAGRVAGPVLVAVLVADGLVTAARYLAVPRRPPAERQAQRYGGAAATGGRASHVLA